MDCFRCSLRQSPRSPRLSGFMRLSETARDAEYAEVAQRVEAYRR
jgi:hypothetical protein